MFLFEVYLKLGKPYLLLPTNSWDLEAIVVSDPLDSLEVVDSEDDIDIISRIVDYYFGYCLFLSLSVSVRLVPMTVIA